MIKRKQELEFSSDLKNLNRVEKFIEEISDQYHINNTYFGNLMIAITEAVTNAIIHGNDNDPDKKVKLEFTSDKRGLAFKVIDEGKGFDYKNVPDPLEAENGDVQNIGRGLFLINSLADQVSFNETANEILMIFEISSINQETTLNRIQQLKQYNTVKSAQKKNIVE
jgi:serine/threonine-protein kinase RsbW